MARFRGIVRATGAVLAAQLWGQGLRRLTLQKRSPMEIIVSI
ncbi:hypothetical protein SAMN04488503_3081 [Humidesulfovibrio mexicanus]|uniref:Uncharacterized protein n=1 Tax=Humidesulfovibrio mexicanus TaxID=147047 RepID=A0A239CF16_9BACT|nr:hypothetical protein SAMN04488503_3081 [Humidesulfovibrio mexicanus]